MLVHKPVLGQYGVVLGVQRIDRGRNAVVQDAVCAVHVVDKAVVCAACAKGIGLLDRAVLFVHPVHLVHDRVEPLGEAALVGIGQLRRADGKAVPAQDVVMLGGDQLVDCGHGGLRPKGGEG